MLRSPITGAAIRQPGGASRSICNVQRVMPKGEVVPVPILCTVTFGEPIQLRPGESKVDFLCRAREAVMEQRPDPLSVAQPVEAD